MGFPPPSKSDVHTVVELRSGGSGGGPTALIARSEGCEQDDACFLIETYRIVEWQLSSLSRRVKVKVEMRVG